MFDVKKTKWRKLENAAKIFPATSNKRDERVFRVVCELKEDINGDNLQKAIDKTMKTFRMFSCVIRKGLFWNYFEESDLKPIVKQECKPPCSRLYVRDKKSLLFEVTYFRRRINFEIFHALSDGTGAVQFMRLLVYNYLMINYDDVEGPASKVGIGMSDREKTENGFSKYYDKKYKKIKIAKYKAAQIRGDRLERDELNIIEAVTSTSEMLKLARSYNTTITIMLTAVLLCSIKEELSLWQIKHPVSLMIPVNLRNLFPSSSMRNFFWWIDLGYNFGTESGEFDDVIAYVADFFKKEITKERMAARVNPLLKWEKNIFLRIVPLDIKQLILQAVQMSGKGNTAIYSNVGKIDMPEDGKKYIEMFDIFTSTPKVEMTTCSFEDKFTITFASAFESTSLMKNFFRKLSDMGLDITISAIVK